MVFLDTHVVVWLYGGLLDKIPKGIHTILNSEDLFISPMVSLEMEYLFEIKRTTEPSKTVVRFLQKQINLQICQSEFSSVIDLARKQKWTRDPFDRIIVAQAALERNTLITKDSYILSNYRHAYWDQAP